ncbi:MAG: hypothetical protein PHV68_02170 [Candidatus Gastranaerophilales bacterium]|nr:hypothetical protein [Candidatus Gastranaerophilales bacterium]
MKQRTLTKCITISTMMLILAAFGNLVAQISDYENFIENNTSCTVAAFDG